VRHLTQALDGMNHTLRYSSTRAEIWRWYWVAWKAKFWRLHILLAAAAAWIVTVTVDGSIDFRRYFLCFAIALPLVIIFMALWPQVMFKSKERVLHVGPGGWSTRIGTQSGSRSWAQVASIQDTSDAVVITGTTGNALIIPSRAFQSPSSKQQFVKDAQSWHSARSV
jgi:hypothetical protein